MLGSRKFLRIFIVFLCPFAFIAALHSPFVEICVHKFGSRHPRISWLHTIQSRELGRGNNSCDMLQVEEKPLQVLPDATLIGKGWKVLPSGKTTANAKENHFPALLLKKNPINGKWNLYVCVFVNVFNRNRLRQWKNFLERKIPANFWSESENWKHLHHQRSQSMSTEGGEWISATIDALATRLGCLSSGIKQEFFKRGLWCVWVQFKLTQDF